MNLTEKQIESSILEWLNYQRGVFAFKVNTTGIYDEKRQCFRATNKFVIKGCADILGILPGGRFLAIEVKTPTTIKRFKNNPSEADQKQISFLNTINMKRGVALCVSSLKEAITEITPHLLK